MATHTKIQYLHNVKRIQAPVKYSINMCKVQLNMFNKENARETSL